MTITYITQHLNTQEKCVKYLEKKRWNNTPVCPYCASIRSGKKKLRYNCLDCKNSYSVTVGTVFENSNLPLYKWLTAISLMLAAKKGLSSLQLSRDISVNKNTAWLLQMKIRTAMKEGKMELFKPRNKSNTGSHTGTGVTKQFYTKPTTNEYYAHFGNKNAFGYWSLFKRAVIGQYHKIESHYFFTYIDEIHFKYYRKHLNDGGYCELMDRLLFVR